MTNRIALNFEDGVTRFIDARPDELIADAAYRLGLNIPLIAATALAAHASAIAKAATIRLEVTSMTR